jgi:hypothetical protein
LVVWVVLEVLEVRVVQKVLLEHLVPVVRQEREDQLRLLHHTLVDLLEVMLEQFAMHLQQMQLLELLVQVVLEVQVLQLRQILRVLLADRVVQLEFYILVELRETIR